MNFLNRALGAAVVCMCLAAPAAHASVVISGTRVVFDADAGEATVRLTNDNTRPALVEAWIDAGNMRATPDTVKTPFLITPPVFRINAHKDQSLRILYVPGQKPLPSDRESIFWLNVLEIPPKPTGAAAHANTLQFAIRTRIKLFYRPDHLSMKRIDAPSKLTWQATAAGQKVTIKVTNPTPYYLTLSKVTVDGHDAKTGMVAPFASLDLVLTGATHAPAKGTKVTYDSLTDFGTAAKHEGVIAQ
ncbi:MAG TPA: fimbria/pilus periplasmic chaperone [Rhodanobacteraceae bacterium]